MMKEYNFDGLVGPTHHYAGLSHGNIASQKNAGTISNPKKAAKQGLQKMRMLMDLGMPQAVLPPHQRPNLNLLKELGFSSAQDAYTSNPHVFSAAFSAASMWVANAATVSPSSNTKDKRVHITPANLESHLHRAQEADFNYHLFKKIFSDRNYFHVHAPLPSDNDVSDEGAANHSNFCIDYSQPGLEMYVYSRTKDSVVFPGRQTSLASESIARTHELKNGYLLVQQNPKAVDAGVFHNDVIAVVNKNVIFYHQDAFVDWDKHRQSIDSFFGSDIHYIEVARTDLSLEESVSSYIFNSQLISLGQDDMALIVPIECQGSKTKAVLDKVLASKNPIGRVEYVDCQQSMLNGGGPACLRLRVPLNEKESGAIHQQVIMTDELYKTLVHWVDKHYRDRLEAKDLLDQNLTIEVCTALDELTQILHLGSIYPCQQI